MIEATSYPLTWPAGWPRTKQRARSRFDRRGLTIYRAFRKLDHELRLLGATGIIISTDLELKRDGTPYASAKADDPGVVAYFKRGGNETCIPCDRWERVEENLWAIACSVEAMRGLDRWGAKSFVDAAFRGFKALPETTGGEPWWTVLGLESSKVSAAEVRAAYRRRAMEVHPDKEGGSEETFRALQIALGHALSALGESKP